VKRLMLVAVLLMALGAGGQTHPCGTVIMPGETCTVGQQETKAPPQNVYLMEARITKLEKRVAELEKRKCESWTEGETYCWQDGSGQGHCWKNLKPDVPVKP